MLVAGLIFFTMTGALGVYSLLQVLRDGGDLADAGNSILLTVGSLLMMTAALWVIVLNRRKRPISPPPRAKPEPKQSPECKVIRVLQSEMLDNLEQAGEQLERFETTGDLDACNEAERCYRIAIQASRKILNGELGNYGCDMSLSLAYLLELRGRREESMNIRRDVVEFYELQASDKSYSGRYMNDWWQAQRACEELAEMSREDGDEAVADLLEEQGRMWVEIYVRNNKFYPAMPRNSGS